MLFLRQSTASQEILLGPFVDSTDGNTAETGLTIANTDIKIWVEGATTEASKNSGGATHISSGRYYAVLDSTDTATVGKMEINVHVSGALPVRREFQVLEEAVYDAWFASGAVGYISNAPVNVAQFGGSNGTFSSGRPEVNLTHISGSAVSTTTAQLGVNVVQVSGDSAAADNAEAFFDGTGYDPNTVISIYRFISADKSAEFVIPSETITAASQGTNVANVGDVAHDNEYVGMLLCIEHGDSSHRWCSPVVSSSASANTITLADTIPSLGYTDPIPCLFLPGGAAYTVGIGANTINASAIASDAGTEIATAVWVSATRTLTANTNLSIPTAADIRSAVGLASANLDTQLGDLPTNAELATALTTSLTTAMTEGYRGTGSTGSVRDLLYEIIAHMGESTISSTTKTLKKLDGSTAKTYTLNSATTPTSITEAT